ncbi:branched-chain amino acid ABC transporter permease [Desulfatitalea alkaliphila]|uniref:Branched-chain amino acid ABC transporter permease n=1 Tax=Desulfatitalea alkaliphila TaxID=2929485 RepID=A0AA41R779_9BACT|nr:branched-chain amino acid ABC transporter permease [Desulfatitalea alkaliphila]MCJ8502941.1 branched-chain amino acid ABC transporter permease [Desulfatitalea alkaliphila]
MESFTLTQQLLQFMVTGLTIGSIYAMVAIGFNIIYNVTEVLNLAQGEFVMLGGLIMVSLHVALGLPLVAAFAATVATVTVVGMLLDRLAIRPVRQPTVMSLIIATVAASMIFKGLAMLIWGKNPYDLPAFSGREPILLGGLVIQSQYLWVIGFMVLVTVLLALFFNRTILGKAMRACSDNGAAARLVGINTQQMVLLAFAVSAAIGAVAGITLTPIALMDYDRGAMLAIKGFAAAILGGLGSFPGAILGGIILGLIESYGAGLLLSGYKDAYALIVLLLVLFLRPSGILGGMAAARSKRV